MIASAVLGVVAALAISARAEPAEAPPSPLVQQDSPAAHESRVALSDKLWMDRFENELATLTGSQLVIDAALAERLLERSEALEPLYAERLEPSARAQLARIEAHLLRLGIWREPVR